MQITNLYRYRGDGGVIDSPILLDAPRELRFRIKAAEGMAITNGEITVDVYDIDAGELENWTEIPAPEVAKDGEAV